LLQGPFDSSKFLFDCLDEYWDEGCGDEFMPFANGLSLVEQLKYMFDVSEALSVVLVHVALVQDGCIVSCIVEDLVV
jgi:hypothetical protein